MTAFDPKGHEMGFKAQFLSSSLSTLIFLAVVLFIYSVALEWVTQTFYAVLDLVVFFVFAIVGSVIALNKSDDYLVLTVSSALVLYATTGSLGFSFLSREFMHVCPGVWFLQSVECARMFRTPTDYWNLLIDLLIAASTVSVPVLTYLFPDGRFVPRWTKWLAAIWVSWGLLVVAFPILNLSVWSPPQYTLLVYVIGLGTGIYAQLYRYHHVSTPGQKQQTKWIVFGFIAASIVGSLLLALIISISYFIPPFKSIQAKIDIVVVSAYFMSQTIVPVCIGMSILRRRLWDVDVVINRTLIYSVLSLVLFLVFWACDKVLGTLVESLLNAFGQFSNLTQYSSQYSGIGSTLIVGKAVSPLHKRIEETINRRFYKDRLHLRNLFTEFAREARNIKDISRLLNLIVKKTCDVLKIRYGAVYLEDLNRDLKLAKSQNLPSKPLSLPDDENTISRLSNGSSIFRSEDKVLPLILSLALPSSAKGKSKASRLVGLLALGPRNSGLGYSSDDRSMLQDFADQVAPAIYFARKKTRRKVKRART